MTEGIIPDSQGAGLDVASIRSVVDAYERSTTGPDNGRLQNTKRMARWSRRLAKYLLAVADEITRLHGMIAEQGEIIRRKDCALAGHDPSRCCREHMRHVTPHVGCILR